MTLKMYVVYDSKVEHYDNPVFFKSRGEAIRSFGDVVNDTGTKFFKHPGDFTFFEVGEFCTETARFTSNGALFNLGTALDFKKPSKEETGSLFAPKVI